jgi:hypothetical protein
MRRPQFRRCFRVETRKRSMTFFHWASASRPYGDPPKWTLQYKERGSAESGALSKPKA